MFTLFVESTRAERVSDTIFVKHKYLTQPSVSPEDVVVAVAHQLMVVLEGNAKGNHKELEILTKVAGLFDKLAKEKTEKANKNKQEQTNWKWDQKAP